MKILLDEIEAKSAQDAELKLCAMALQAGVKATFSEVYPLRAYAGANSEFMSFCANAELDSMDDTVKLVGIWLGYEVTEDELDEFVQVL